MSKKMSVAVTLNETALQLELVDASSTLGIDEKTQGMTLNVGIHLQLALDTTLVELLLKYQRLLQAGMHRDRSEAGGTSIAGGAPPTAATGHAVLGSAAGKSGGSPGPPGEKQSVGPAVLGATMIHAGKHTAQQQHLLAHQRAAAAQYSGSSVAGPLCAGDPYGAYGGYGISGGYGVAYAVTK